ncbi:MAG TPA: acyl-CoA dehydrogenase family protein [Acidimicrobiales bacterium]|nr:acyl-CoA dehydrogenase family protein [Acidimicrobiales bacterium]
MTVVEDSPASTDVDEQRVHALIDQLLEQHPPRETDRVTFLGAQFDLGLAWVHFDEGDGGLGIEPRHQKVVLDRLGRAGAPHPGTSNPIGYGMGAPTIAACATPDQRKQWLRPLFTGEEVWCQLFSEPGAGSDVASLATRAVRDGDEWVVNGQKVWTTMAHLARWGMLVARTDPDQPKHKGLTYFVIDFDQPGVEVRPLRQMTGEAEFNEVYFTDARTPDTYRLGEVGEGWRVAITTLMNERVSIGGTVPPRGSGVIAKAVQAWRDGGHDDPARRDRLMSLWIRAEILRLTNLRAAQGRRRGTPGPEGSIGKAAMADLNKEILELAVDLLGADGMLYDSYAMKQPDIAMDFSAPTQKVFLRARANSIEGGTTEVMKNILGERVLGLPGDVRTDKDVPWKDVPRN